jgi:hypothetical protein
MASGKIILVFSVSPSPKSLETVLIVLPDFKSSTFSFVSVVEVSRGLGSVNNLYFSIINPFSILENPTPLPVLIKYIVDGER